jgi:hypothetical protein
VSPPAPVITPELRTLLRQVKLGQLMATLPERLALARARDLSHAEFLELILSDEVTRRAPAIRTAEYPTHRADRRTSPDRRGRPRSSRRYAPRSRCIGTTSLPFMTGRTGDVEDADPKAPDHAMDAGRYLLLNLGGGAQFPVDDTRPPGLLEAHRIEVMEHAGLFGRRPTDVSFERNEGAGTTQPALAA